MKNLLGGIFVFVTFFTSVGCAMTSADEITMQEDVSALTTSLSEDEKAFVLYEFIKNPQDLSLHDLDEMTEALINVGANVRVVDEFNNTLLHLASEKGYDFIVKRLLAVRGDYDVMEVSINAVNSNGDTPLHKAARGGHIKVIKRLIACQTQGECCE